MDNAEIYQSLSQATLQTKVFYLRFRLEKISKTLKSLKNEFVDEIEAILIANLMEQNWAKAK